MKRRPARTITFPCLIPKICLKCSRYLVKNVLRLLNDHIFTLSSYKIDNYKLLTNLKIREVDSARCEQESIFQAASSGEQFTALQASEAMLSAASSFANFLLQKVQILKIELRHSRQIFFIFLCLYLLLSSAKNCRQFCKKDREIPNFQYII